MGRRYPLATAVFAGSVSLLAQPPQFSNTVRTFIKVDAPVIALTDVRVIDGTGAAPRERQTIVLRDGLIAEIGNAARVKVPEGASANDLTGKSVIPGLVMVERKSTRLNSS